MRNLIERLHNPDSKYTVRQLLRWLWRVLRGNRRQVVLNASLGLMGVVCSLLMVWAMQRAIDTASGVREGSIYIGMKVADIEAEYDIRILAIQREYNILMPTGTTVVKADDTLISQRL